MERLQERASRIVSSEYWAETPQMQTLSADNARHSAQAAAVAAATAGAPVLHPGAAAAVSGGPVFGRFDAAPAAAQDAAPLAPPPPAALPMPMRMPLPQPLPMQMPFGSHDNRF